MNSEKQPKKPSLLRLFLTGYKLQWSLAGWKSLVTPTVETASNLLSIARSYFYAQIINLVALYIGGKTQSIFPVFWIYVAVILGISLLNPVISAIDNYFSRTLQLSIRFSYQTRIMQKISTLDAEYFEDAKFQNMLSRVKDMHPAFALNDLSRIISGFITLVIASVAVLKLNWVLFILALVAALPRIYSNILNAKENREVLVSQSEQHRIRYHIVDILSEWNTIKELRPFGAIKWFQKRLNVVEKNITDAHFRKIKKFTLMNTFTDMIGAILYIATRVWLFLKVISTKGVFGIGDYTFYDNLIGQIEASSSNMVSGLNSIHEELLAIEDYHELMNLPGLVTNRGRAKRIDHRQAPQIEFVNVSFKYPNSKKYTLKNVSFKLDPKKKMALIGVNGAGKSTLVKLMLRFYDPTEGKILVNGVNLKDIDLNSWYKTLAVIQQDFNHYTLSVAENISFETTNRIDKKKLKSAISSAEADFVYKLPKQENTMLTRFLDDSVDLSGGQWQKIGLARVFYRKAPFLILDEPTSAIDARAESGIFHKLWSLQKNKGALVISHRFSTVRDADVIIVIDNGKIIEQGTHEQLMKNEKIYHELFTKQAKSYR